MRKNMLIWMLGVSFVCFGLCVTETEASGSARTATTNHKLGVTGNKSKRIEFNTKYAELKRLCANKPGPICDLAISIADASAQIGWLTCDIYGQSSQTCWDSLDWALAVFYAAMDVCRNEPYIATDFRRRIDELFQNMPVGARKATALTE